MKIKKAMKKILWLKDFNKEKIVYIHPNFFQNSLTIKCMILFKKAEKRCKILSFSLKIKIDNIYKVIK